MYLRGRCDCERAWADGGFCVQQAASEFALCESAGHGVMEAAIVGTTGGAGGQQVQALHAVMGAGHAEMGARHAETTT